MAIPQDLVEIQSDGITVWIHYQGETIARFGRLGIDIHTSIKEQLQGSPQCLSCSHQATTWTDWQRFVQVVNQYFGIQIGEEYMPSRFNTFKAQKGTIQHNE